MIGQRAEGMGRTRIATNVLYSVTRGKGSCFVAKLNKLKNVQQAQFTTAMLPLRYPWSSLGDGSTKIDMFLDFFAEALIKLFMVQRQMDIMMKNMA
jgi:hypothetical protein